MRKIFAQVTGSILLVLSLAAFSKVYAATPEKLQAKFVSYDDSKHQMIAQGRVEFADGSITVRADEARYDTEKNVVYFQGATLIIIADFGFKKEKANISCVNPVFFRKTRQLVAEGPIIIEFGKTKIEGSVLSYDQQESLVSMPEAKVANLASNEILSGKNFTYHSKLDRGSLDEFNGTLRGSDIWYYAKGKKIIFSQDTAHIDEGEVSSCGYSDRLYHFTAQSADYRKDKFLKMQQCGYWEREKKWVSVHRIDIPLTNKNIKTTSGYSRYDGMYVKTTEIQDLPGKNYREVFKDATSLNGLGIGFREYHINSGREQYWGAYAAINPIDFGSYWKGEYETKGTGGQLLWSVQKMGNVAWERRNELSSQLSYLGRQGAYKHSLDLYYAFQPANSDTSSFNVSLSETIKLSKKVQFAVSGNYWQNKSLLAPESSNYQSAMELEYTEKKYFSQLTYQQSKYGVDVSPQFAISTTLDSPFQFDFSSARNVNHSNQVDVSQVFFAGRYMPDSWRIAPGIFFSTGIQLQQTNFSDSNSISQWNAIGSVMANFSRRFYGSMTYRYASTRGVDSLWNVDNTSKQTQLETLLHYRINSDYRVHMRSRFNLLSGGLDSLRLMMDGRSYPLWNWSVESEYSGILNQWTRVSAFFTFNPKSSITGLVRFDFNPVSANFEQASIRLEGPIAKVWTYNIKLDYDVQNPNFKVAEIQMVRVGTCRDVVFSFYPYDKVFFVQLRLKNF